MVRRTRVRIDPRACDRCGRCLAACSRNAIRIGRTFIAVDPISCDGCGACIAACGSGALTASSGSAPAHASARGVRRAPVQRLSEHPASTPRARSTTTDSRVEEDWTLLEALTMLAVTLAAFVGKEIFLALAPIRALPVAALVWARAVALGAYYLAQLCAVRWLSLRRGRTLKELVLSEERRTGSTMAAAQRAIGVLLGARAAAIAYGFLMRAAGMMPDSSALLRTFGTDPAGLVLAAVLVVCVGPVVEELVFRGVLLHGLRGRLGAPGAIAVQALIFAALHRSAWLFAPMAVLGAGLGWLAVSDRHGLRTAMAVHGAYNAITVVAALALGR